MKIVKCIETSKYNYPSVKGKTYLVLRETVDTYYIHNISVRGELKERFIEIEANENIVKILYGK